MATTEHNDPPAQRATLTFETFNTLTAEDVEQIESVLADFADWRGVRVVQPARTLTVHHLVIHPVDEDAYAELIGIAGAPVECRHCREDIWLERHRGPLGGTIEVWVDDQDSVMCHQDEGEPFGPSDAERRHEPEDLYQGRSIVAEVEVWDDGTEVAFPVRTDSELWELAESDADAEFVGSLQNVLHDMVVARREGKPEPTERTVGNYEVVWATEVQA